MYATTYSRATSLDDAVAKLKAAEDGKFLAGGQTLIATMKQRLAAPTALVDITRIPDLKGITADSGSVTIGAATTHAEVADSPDVKRAIPALAGLAEGIGDPAVRNMGTLGGVLANNDPASDYPAAVMGLDATIQTTKGSYTPAEYFRGIFETALDEDEIITRVTFPVPQKAAYEKFRNQASRYALCSVFVAVLKSGEPRVAVSGSGGEGVFRVTEMEVALKRDFSPGAVSGIRVSPDQMLSDIHGSAEYRAHLVTVLAARAVAEYRHRLLGAHEGGGVGLGAECARGVDEPGHVRGHHLGGGAVGALGAHVAAGEVVGVAGLEAALGALADQAVVGVVEELAPAPVGVHDEAQVARGVVVEGGGVPGGPGEGAKAPPGIRELGGAPGRVGDTDGAVRVVVLVAGAVAVAVEGLEMHALGVELESRAVAARAGERGVRGLHERGEISRG